MRLARRQERELRAWLYGGRPRASRRRCSPRSRPWRWASRPTTRSASRPSSSATAARRASRALLGAIRESVINAARHAGVDQVDVYVEIDDAVITGFVRDTGRGFDPARRGRDRQGISESIVGRIERSAGPRS